MTLGLYIRYKIRLRKIYAKLARESQEYKTNPEIITFYIVVRSMRNILGRDAVIVFKNFLVRREKDISLRIYKSK